MNETEVKSVVDDVLGRRFSQHVFRGSDIRFDRDFDGEQIIRVIAHYDERPAERHDLVRSVHALRSALLERGEERFVFLTNDIATERQAEPDLD